MIDSAMTKLLHHGIAIYVKHQFDLTNQYEIHIR